jgi:hypothetical protein
MIKKNFFCRAGMVVYTYNPRYLGGGDWKDHGSKPAWTKSY